MAVTQTYVDPSIAGNSGSGTIGDPYGDLQYALDQVTRDSSNGDQFNIKAGTAEILADGLDLTSYGTPDNTAPISFRGYTSAANDGGMGEVDCNDTYKFLDSTGIQHVRIQDMEIHSSGSVNIIHLGNYGRVVNCYIHSTTGYGIRLGGYGQAIGCHIENIGDRGVSTGFSCAVLHCVFTDGANAFNRAIELNAGAIAMFNYIDIDLGINALYLNSDVNIAAHNTIYGDSANTSGIVCWGKGGVVINNVIIGFSGVSGKGITVSNGAHIIRDNYVYNNTTHESISGNVFEYEAATALSDYPLLGDTWEPIGILRNGSWPDPGPDSGAYNFLNAGASQYNPKLRRNRARYYGA